MVTADPTKPGVYGPDTLIAITGSLVLQGLAIMDLVPISYWAFALPLVAGLVLVAFTGRCRRIGVGLLMSLITLPFSMIGVLISSGVFALLHG